MKRGGALAFFSRNMNMWLILALVAVFIFLAVIIVQYNSAATANRNAKNIANMRAGSNSAGIPSGGGSSSGETKGLVNAPAGMREGFAGTSDIQALFFHVDWCPHCVRAKPEWEKFVQKHSSEGNITFVGGEDGINCTNNDDKKVRDMIQKYNIEHFPTIYFIKDGEKKEFQSSVSTDSLEGFLKEL